MNPLKTLKLKIGGNIGIAIGALVLGLVVLFVGLYMVTIVSSATNVCLVV